MSAVLTIRVVFQPLCYSDGTFVQAPPPAHYHTGLFMYFSLRISDYATIALAFAAVPEGVTSLGLSWNGLGSKENAEFYEIFAAIPASVISLDLTGNELARKTGAELAEVFIALSEGVTSLNLSDNGLLGLINNAALFQIFAAIPPSVTSLDLSWNGIGSKANAELIQAFAAIPSGVTCLNLSGSRLGKKNLAELKKAFAVIPNGVRVILKSNHLFTNKTRTEKDALITALRQSNPRITLVLFSDAQRAIAPLACLAKKPLGDKRVNIPPELLIHSLSFLLPKNTPLPRTYKMFLDTFNIVNLRPSINNRLMIGHAFSLEFFNKYFDIPQAPKGVLLIKDAEEASNERNIPKKDNSDWFKFMVNILAMKEIQLAAIALGTVILLSCSDVGMVVLGDGLVTAGAAGLALNFFSPNEARDDTGLNRALA